MASGRAHDRATTVLALPFGLLWGPSLGAPGVAIASLAFLVGGLWLSPDLDTHSRATARWGPLRQLWWPYRRLLRHRSLVSHSPVLGSAGRLAYLLGVLALLTLLLGAAPGPPLPLPPPAAWPELAARLWHTQPLFMLCALTGLEASSWLHLLQDGDPLPRPPRVLRWLGKRLRTSHGQGRRPERKRRATQRQRGR
jgi:uncharacterized metal-binding protein